MRRVAFHCLGLSLVGALVLCSGCSSSSNSATSNGTDVQAITTSSTVVTTPTTGDIAATARVAKLAVFVSWCGTLQRLATSKDALVPSAALQSETIALLQKDPVVDLSPIVKRITAPYLAAAALLQWRDYCPADEIAKAAAAVSAAAGSG